MNVQCSNGFDQTLLSGFLDEELTQGDEQWVTVHLEDCSECRATLEELRRLREVTMATEFDQPEDRQWDERPRTLGSGLMRGLGWVLLVTWAVVTGAFALWELATSPEGLFVKVLTFGGIAAVVALLLSVLIDRIRDARTDRYRGVMK